MWSRIWYADFDDLKKCWSRGLCVQVAYIIVDDFGYYRCREYPIIM